LLLSLALMASMGGNVDAFISPMAGSLNLRKRSAASSMPALRMVGATDRKLKELGISLPQRPPPAANYDPYVVSGKYAYVSGQLPMVDGQIAFTGKVGADLSVDEGYQSARLCGLNLISQVKEACDGDLDRVKRVVKLVGFVNCPADFVEQPKVINGASDVMNEVFGSAGRHARSAVGTNTLPFGVATEVEGIFEISASMEYGFDPEPVVDKRGRPLFFTKGMKVEAVDRSFKDIITVATIKDIDGDRILIGFDGWPDNYDYWLNKDDGDFQPPGTCQRANARLSPPNGYVGYFDWGSYLDEEDAVAAPPTIFTSTKVFPTFKGDVSVKFELWHRMEATVGAVPPSPEQQQRDENRANK